MHLRPPFTDSPLRIWAVEDTTIQLTWGALPAGEVTADTAGARSVIDHPGGPGVLLLSGLLSSTTYRVDVRFPGGSTQLSATTLAPPPGPLLGKIATVSDLHLGARHWGFLKTMVEDDSHDVPFPVRCARAAIAEAADWGAELLIIKGDAAHHRHPDNFDLLAELVDAFPELPMLLIPGNHDVDYLRSLIDLPSGLGRRELPFIRGAAHCDIEGLRIIAGDTTIPGRGEGTLAGIGTELVSLAGEAPGPVFLAIHHHLHRFPIMTHYPRGIAKAEAAPFLRQLALANPATMVTSGHSHRNRARRHAGLTVTEVASTRDWPGVWAGYAVHEGGIRQVVRKAAAPDAVVWHEYSRGAVLGIWDLWAPGTLGQRCLTVAWPQPTRR